MAGQAAEALGVSRRTICHWLFLRRGERTLENKTSRRRKSSISLVAKIVMTKSVLKRGQSTRKLAKAGGEWSPAIKVERPPVFDSVTAV